MVIASLFFESVCYRFQQFPRPDKLRGENSQTDWDYQYGGSGQSDHGDTNQ
jgi:hypothetical protein